MAVVAYGCCCSDGCSCGCAGGGGGDGDGGGGVAIIKIVTMMLTVQDIDNWNDKFGGYTDLSYQVPVMILFLSRPHRGYKISGYVLLQPY